MIQMVDLELQRLRITHFPLSPPFIKRVTQTFLHNKPQPRDHNHLVFCSCMFFVNYIIHSFYF